MLWTLSLNCGGNAAEVHLRIYFADKGNRWSVTLQFQSAYKTVNGVRSSLVGGTGNGPACTKPLYIRVTSLLLRSLTPAPLSSFISFTAAHEVRFRFPSFLALDEIVNNWILATGTYSEGIVSQIVLSYGPQGKTKVRRPTEWRSDQRDIHWKLRPPLRVGWWE